MEEFDNVADIEKYAKKVEKDKTHMKMWQELMQLIVPATYSGNIWNTVM
jgi:hypothetical protein